MLFLVKNDDLRIKYMYEKIIESFEAGFYDEELGQIDTLVIPPLGIDNFGFIKNTTYKIEELIRLHNINKILTGVKSDLLVEIGNKLDVNVISYLEIDNVREKNSLFTAEGLLAILIEKTDYSILDKKILVLGYGASGKKIVELLRKLDIDVAVYAKEKYKEEIEKLNVPYFNNLFTSCSNIIINTIPKLILDEKNIDKICVDYIFDISSKPGGVDFNYAEEKGIKAFLCPRIPSLYMVMDAGYLLGDSIVSILNVDK